MSQFIFADQFQTAQRNACIEFLALEEKIAKAGSSRTELKGMLYEIAQAYRQYCSDIYPFMLDTGYIRIFRGEAYGWCADKGVASTERPQAILVGIDGQIFQAVGGNDQIGAKKWEIWGD